MSLLRNFSVTILLLLCSIVGKGQGEEETRSYFNFINAIVTTEKSGDSLVHKLDTLRSKFILSRSYVNDYFNRDIGFGVKHRRITMSLNFAGFQLDLLCRNDTVVLSSVTSTVYKGINAVYIESDFILRFLNERNRFYNSSKSIQQLTREIALSEQYAFYCGDGLPKTQKGAAVDQLVYDEDAETLIAMVKSFHCETQAYGVAGLEDLAKEDYPIPFRVQKLISHIKKRNSELVTCTGCISGVISKIY